MFSCELCDISKITFFTEHLQTTASADEYPDFWSQSYNPDHNILSIYNVSVQVWLTMDKADLIFSVNNFVYELYLKFSNNIRLEKLQSFMQASKSRWDTT